MIRLPNWRRTPTKWRGENSLTRKSRSLYIHVIDKSMTNASREAEGTFQSIFVLHLSGVRWASWKKKPILTSMRGALCVDLLLEGNPSLPDFAHGP